MVLPKTYSMIERVLRSGFLMLCAFAFLTCDESLPIYAPPENVLGLSVTTIEQLNDHIAPPGQQVVHLVLVGENIHDEVFLDSVNVKGSLRIWWKRKPSRYRTLYLSEKNFSDRTLIHNKKLMLVPGQKFSIDVYWDLRSDGGLYLPEEMDFARLTQHACGYNVACSYPEDFVVETSLNVYDRLGYVSAPPREFVFVGRICPNCGFPPCPAPAGGCQ